MSQQSAQSQQQPSSNNLMSPAHTPARSVEDPSEVPDPRADESSAFDHPMQPGSAPQAEGNCRSPAPRAVTASDASPWRGVQSAPFAVEPGLADEDEGLGLDQEGAGGVRDEEEEQRPGDVTAPPGDPGLGSESDPGAGLVAEGGVWDGDAALPEEGWMWSVARAPEQEKRTKENQKSKKR